MDVEPGHASLPPGYPREYQCELVLRDGRKVLIRPILPGDAAELADAIKTADPDTLRRRFLGGPPRITPALLTHLTVVDYVRRFALAAIDPASRRGVAVGRYEPAGEGVADIAVVVSPAWRRAGLATVLILLLAKAAAERGIHTFSASYLAENRPIATLVQEAGGLCTQVIEQGIAEFSLTLDRRARSAAAGTFAPVTAPAASARMRCMTPPVGADRAHQASELARLARRVVDTLGGRYSAELGIDVDAGDAEIERWFLAATLFGTRISAVIAERTFRVLSDAGLARIGQARHIPEEDFIAFLDEGGYARYDAQTATRLHALSDMISERYDGRAAVIGRRFTTYPALRAALDVLPGWGPVTIQLFLRELRGVWPGAQPPLDQRAESAARHLGLLGPDPAPPDLPRLARLAAECHTDPRDLESGLVRLTLAHHRQGMGTCPGGHLCTLLT
ncbi:MAG TPA: GNAT family N-acetyltransferase [Streptosporangiaceae bacterium]|nr:GNAT family N-acetyltransferase [Streptosporangiaceae bacterium]